MPYRAARYSIFAAAPRCAWRACRLPKRWKGGGRATAGAPAWRSAARQKLGVSLLKRIRCRQIPRAKATCWRDSTSSHSRAGRAANMKRPCYLSPRPANLLLGKNRQTFCGALGGRKAPIRSAKTATAGVVTAGGGNGRRRQEGWRGEIRPCRITRQNVKL